MGLTRRRLLATWGVGVSSLTGGCTGLNPLDPGDGDGEEPTDGGTTTGTDGERTETGTPTPTPTQAAPVGGSETDRVYEELTWFATRYRPAVDRYRSTAERARSLIVTLERQSSVSESDVERLRGLLDRVEELLYEELVPHFDAEPTVRSFNDEHLERIATFRERRDWDGVKRVLGEMEERYRTLTSDRYVEATFPVDPIRGPFARLLTADGATTGTAVLCYLPSVDYLTRVQADPGEYRGDIAGGRLDVQQYERLLEPVSVGASRESRAFLTYTALTHSMRSQPAFVQQYRDGEAADDAIRQMLSGVGSVTADGTELLGGREWRRVYYQAASEVTYAHLHRTGRYVLTVAPSRTPWDERPSNWTDALKRTWFWE